MQQEVMSDPRGVADGRVAFVDESMRTSPSGGLYLVSAAIVAEADRRVIEERLRAATGRRRVHWRNEAEEVRRRVINLLAVQPLSGVSAVVAPMPARRQERARVLAWWTLACQLEDVDVRELVIESRQEKLNARDRRTLAAIRRAGIATRLHYRFGLPNDEPGLWVADVVAGALGQKLARADTRYVDRLPARLLELHRIVP